MALRGEPGNNVSFLLFLIYLLGLMNVQISDAGSERAAIPPADLQQAD